MTSLDVFLGMFLLVGFGLFIGIAIKSLTEDE